MFAKIDHPHPGMETRVGVGCVCVGGGAAALRGETRTNRRGFYLAPTISSFCPGSKVSWE